MSRNYEQHPEIFPHVGRDRCAPDDEPVQHAEPDRPICPACGRTLRIENNGGGTCLACGALIGAIHEWVEFKKQDEP